VARAVRPTLLIGAITTASLLLYVAISVLRWWHFDLDSFDLPIYHQIVWHLSRFEAPAVSILGEANYFGDHFSPILALFAPLYAVAPSPVVLMAGQAALIAAAIPAVYLYARRRVPEVVALLICIAFSQSWGVWAAIDSAVHEVAFAVPLIAWGVYFADGRRWVPMYACLSALLLVKEDLGLVVATFGVVLALRGERRHGALVAVAGLAALVIVNAVLMPAFNPHGWSPRDAALYAQYGDSLGSAALHLATHPGALIGGLVDDSQKLRLVALMLGAYVGLPLLSPLTLLAVPLVAERLLAGDPNLWAPQYQYSLIPMVILAMASADGTELLLRWARGRRAIPYLLPACAATISLVSAIAFPVNRLLHSGYWTRSPADHAALLATRVVPDNASVAADWGVLAHVPPRDAMYLLGQVPPRAPAFVVARGRGVGAGRYELFGRFPGVAVYRRRSAGTS
jgi:uncharacterized membrane protein